MSHERKYQEKSQGCYHQTSESFLLCSVSALSVWGKGGGFPVYLLDNLHVLLYGNSNTYRFTCEISDLVLRVGLLNLSVKDSSFSSLE